MSWHSKDFQTFIPSHIKKRNDLLYTGINDKSNIWKYLFSQFLKRSHY